MLAGFRNLLVKEGTRRADGLSCCSCSGACPYTLNVVMESPGYQGTVNNTLKQRGEFLAEWCERRGWLFREHYLQYPGGEELSSACLQTANYLMFEITKYDITRLQILV